MHKKNECEDDEVLIHFGGHSASGVEPNTSIYLEMVSDTSE
jgi:hypothetical protein